MCGVCGAVWVDCVIVKANNLFLLSRGILIYFEVGLHSSMRYPAGRNYLIPLIPEIDGLQGQLQVIAVQLTDNTL